MGLSILQYTSYEASKAHTHHGQIQRVQTLRLVMSANKKIIKFKTRKDNALSISHIMIYNVHKINHVK